MLVVLKEKHGNFGPIVSANFFQADNLYVMPSVSGKLTKGLVKKWLTEVYLKEVPDESVLLLDSWTKQNEENILSMLPDNKRIIVKTIPKKTTGMIQPLDVYGFRIWKQFLRYLYDLILL